MLSARMAYNVDRSCAFFSFFRVTDGLDLRLFSESHALASALPNYNWPRQSVILRFHVLHCTFALLYPSTINLPACLPSSLSYRRIHEVRDATQTSLDCDSLGCGQVVFKQPTPTETDKQKDRQKAWKTDRLAGRRTGR